MNYAFRLGLLNFMRRDPNGIRRDPYCGARGIVLLTWVRCYLLAGSDGSRGDAMSWVIMLIAWVWCMLCAGILTGSDGIRTEP